MACRANAIADAACSTSQEVFLTHRFFEGQDLEKKRSRRL